MLIGMYVLLIGSPISWAIPISGTLSAVLVILALIVRIRTGHHEGLASLLSVFRRRMTSTTAALLLVILFGAAIPLCQCMSHFSIFLPVRLGIDGVLYSVMTQTAGQSWESLSGIAGDGWLLHLRWGYPLFLANNLILSGEQHPFAISPASLALVHGLIAGSGVIFFRRSCHMPLLWAMIGGLLLVMNCTLLNVMLEGQWAHALAIPLLTLCIGILYSGRNFMREMNRTQVLKLVGISALFFSCLLVTYSEILPLLMLFIFLIVCGDIVRGQAASAFRTLAFAGAVLLCGCTLVLPYSARTLDHLSHRNLAPSKYWQPQWGDPLRIAALANPGYWQPRWAMPCEILGLANPYSEFVTWTPPEVTTIRLRRSGLEILWRTSLTAATVAVMYIGLKRLRADLPFWLAPIAIVAIGFAKFKWLAVPGGHNYTYMKVYASMIPCLSAPFLVGLMPGSTAFGRVRISRQKPFLAVAACALIGWSSFRYLGEFGDNCTRVGAEYLTLTDPAVACLLSDRFLYLPRQRGKVEERRRNLDRVMEFYFLPLLPNRTVIDQWRADGLDRSLMPDDRKKTFCVFCNKHELGISNSISPSPGTRIVYQDDAWLFLDIGKTIDGIAPDRPLVKADLIPLWEIMDQSTSNH